MSDRHDKMERFERTGEYRFVKVGEDFETEGGPQRCYSYTIGKYWILRRIDEPKPEPEKEPVYETAEECATAVCNLFYLVTPRTKQDVENIISRYCPRDAVIEECIEAAQTIIKRTVCGYERDGQHTILDALRGMKGGNK